MSLANMLLRSTLGNDRPPEKLEVALFRGSTEVKDPGYSRARIQKGSWNITGEHAFVTATFGPFRGTVSYDRALVFRGTFVVDEKALPGGMRQSNSTDVVRLPIDLDLSPVND